MAPSSHSKVTSTQSESIFLLFDQWNIVLHLRFELSQSFSDISSLPILIDVQRFHENGK